MDENRLNERIRSAYSHAAPDRLDEILAACESKKGTVINMNEKRKNRFIPIALAAALALALVGGIIGYSFGSGRGSDVPGAAVTPGAQLAGSVVTLDVNPSIELDVDADDTVTAVRALNEDARIVIGTMDFAGSSLEVTVNALIGSMLTNGYLGELRNSILVSVSGGDSARATALQQSVSGMIEAALGTGGVSGAVISQTLTSDAAVTDLAASYNITEGKAALIQKLVAADPTLTVESLVSLSVNDIALITSSRGLSDGSVTQTGTASSGAYIGADAALSAALSHAGLTEADLSARKIEFDSENGRMVYEIDLYTASGEYEYDIDASTGAVVKFEREIYPSTAVTPNTPAGGNYIGEAAAKSAALSHAGVADAVWTKAQFDRDDGRYVYELEFVADNTEFDYKIDALSGEVVESSRETFYGGPTSGQTGGSPIGEAAAKSAALSHAGVSESDASRIRVEFDYDDGFALYEVEFRVGRVEYEYEIDAYSGSILKAERDAD